MPCRHPRRPRAFPAHPGPLALLLAGALALCAPSAAPAQEPAPPPPAEAGPDGPARFLIETLTVEGAKETVARIVAAETLLEEGETYTEADLRQAVARIHRLPFVVDATFALRKGSARGAYELVIQVEPARWFFFEHAAQVSWADYPQSSLIEEDGSFDILSGQIGARTFVGRSGVLFVSTGYREHFDTGVSQLGYTQYDLFGRGMIANVFVSSGYTCCGVVEDRVLFESTGLERLRAGLDLVIPLSRFHALQIDWTEQWGELDFPFSDRDLEVDLRQREVALRWVRDTSDDPLLPRHGSALSGGLEYVAGDGYTFSSFPLRDFDVHGFESLTADLTATRHWPLTPRQSVSTGGRLYGERIESDLRTALLPGDRTRLDRVGGSLSARHLFRLWTLREPGNLGDLYLETGATWNLDHASDGLDLGGLVDDESRRLELSTALIYRSQWGRLRFGFSYFGGETR